MPAHSFATKAAIHDLWRELKPRLESLDIELTERCNSACRHCYINLPEDDTAAAARELDTDRWKDVLLQAAELGSLSVCFTGGEPLLRGDFADLYLFARRLGIKVVLFTNARLITSELAELFSRVPPLEKIEITAYGMRRQTYESVTRSPGSYNEFRRGVRLLLERRVPFIVKWAVLPHNRMELDEFETWASALPWPETPPGYVMLLDLRARRDSPERNRAIRRLRLSPEDIVSLLKRREKSYREEMNRFCARFMGPACERLFSCGAGKSLSIDAYGRIQPCLLLRNPALTFDIRRVTLRQALEEFSPRLGEIKAAAPDYLGRCARCFLHGFCEQCPAKSWIEHGTLDKPVDYLCEVAHAQARFLGLLKENEKGWEVSDWRQRVGNLQKGEQTA